MVLLDPRSQSAKRTSLVELMTVMIIKEMQPREMINEAG